MVAEGADNMGKDDAIELLKNVADDLNINEQVFSDVFVDQATSKTLEQVTKENMHTCSQIYFQFMEKQKAKELYEARKEMYEF